MISLGSLADLMTPNLVAGLAVVVAGLICVVVVDGRAVALGLLVALLLSPFVASPLPDGLEIAARVVAALLAAYVLWIVMKGGAARSEGTALGAIAEAAIAAGAYVIGWWLQPVHPLQGPLSEQATGFALVALAVLPLAGSNVLRIGVGAMLLTLGMSFIMETWLGPSPVLVQLAVTALLLVIPAALAVLIDVNDEAAQPTPAVDQVRPEMPEPPRPEPVFVPSVLPDAPASSARRAPNRGRAASAGSVAVAASSDGEAASSEEAAGVEPHDAHSGERIVGPRPSVRFLGRKAPVRGRAGQSARAAGDEPTSGSASPAAESGTEREAAPASRPDETRGASPTEGRAASGAQPPAEPPEPPEPPESPAKVDPDARDAPVSHIRERRDPRNPRSKRPLR